MTKLIPMFVKLLKDKEPEVRATACTLMSDVGSEVKGSETLLAPALEALATDPVQTVRVRVASGLILLCKRFSKDTALKVVIPLLKVFAKDENYEVRAAIVSEIDKLAEYVDPSALSSVFPLLVELSKDAKWRVRAAVIDKSSMLARHMGVKKFEKQLQNIVVSALSDHVFAIREKACVQIGYIVKLFSGKWAAEKLLPLAFSIYDKNANYLYRMTCLLLIQHVVAECPPDVVEKTILPLVLLAAADDVANVRVMAAKTFSLLIPKLDGKSVKAKISPALVKMAKDSDGDVNYFSNKTLRDHKSAV
jgi:serine/threonine-protein phosphatase 2A regulatory subunit A